jgi:hypothetical protein
MYTRIQFGLDLKEILKKTQDPFEIGQWAFSVYWDHVADLEHEVRAIALTLNTMEDAPEFAFTYEELEKISDDLIAGKSVIL